MLKAQHIIERARLVQFDPKHPATFVLVIDGKQHYLDAPEAAQYVQRLADYLNDELREAQERRLLNSIPITAVVEDY